VRSPGVTPSAGSGAAAGGGNPFGAAAASYLSGRDGTVLAAVYDLGTGRTWRIGRGQPQAEASVVKLDVLETLLDERDSGLSASDRALAARMIEDSDNDAATSLWHEVGGAARIRAFNARAGLTQTAPSSCVVCPGFAWPGWGLTTTTPDDQIALLRQLVMPDSVLTPAAREYALSLMENVIPSQRWGITAGVPAGVTVALKNGWLPLRGPDSDWQVNSVGWVSGRGRDYLMAVLSTGNPSAQYGIDTISRLATMVWRQMG
jgi:Beta-lactamase enzyme family